MSGELIIRQNSGEPLGKVEAIASSNSYVRGDVDGTTPAVPTLNVRTVSVSDKWLPADMHGEDVVLSSEGGSQYGSIKTVSTSRDSMLANLGLDPILAKLNQQVTVQPTWGRGDQVFESYVQQVFSACGVNRWYMPGTTWLAVEGSGGLSARFVQNNNFEASGSLYASATSSRMTTYLQGKQFSPLPLGAGSDSGIVLVAPVSRLLTSTESRSITLTNTGDDSEQAGRIEVQIGLSKPTAKSVKVDLRVYLDGSSTASVSGTTTLNSLAGDIPSTAVVKSYIALEVNGVSSKAVLNSAVVSKDNEVIATTAGTGLNYTFSYSGSNVYVNVDRLILTNQDDFYVYFGGDAFSVTNSVPMYSYSLNHGTSSSSTNTVTLPGTSDTGWAILNKILLVCNYVFDTNTATFTHASATSNLSKVPGEVGVSVGDSFSINLNSREVGRYADIYNYNYTRTASGNSVGKLWMADSTYSVGVGETREETITLPEGSYAVSVKSPSIVSPQTLVSYINGNTANSGYSVYTNDGNDITPAMWTNYGGGITARIGDTPSEIILTITGPDSRLFPGNDEVDNGSYEIASVPGSNRSIVLAGIGITGNKKLVRTYTGATGPGVKDVAVEYDNVFVGSNDTLWNVAAKLAERYGTYESSVELDLVSKGSADTVGATAKTSAPNLLRVGPYGVQIGTYAVSERGAINTSDVVLRTTIGSVDAYYAGKTIAEVNASKTGMALKSDAIFPLGKDIK